MRARTSRRAAALVVAAAAFAASALGTTGAGAHGAPNSDRRWIAQSGNGGGSSQPIPEGQGLPVLEDMNVLSVLYHPERFPFDNGAMRPGFGRYVAFGLMRVNPQELNDTLVSQVAISHSENGLSWSAPQPVTIRDPDGVPVPFMLNEPGGFFDVVYQPENIYPAQFPFTQFAILYRTLSSDPAASSASDLHIAWSDDGQSWYGDQEIEEDSANPILSGGFTSGSLGPTDVILQQDSSLHPSVRAIAEASNCSSADPDGAGPMAATPWNCRLVMLYDAIDGAGRHQVAIAGAPRLGHPGSPEDEEFPTPPTFSGAAAPLIPNGAAGQWDDEVATLAKVRIRPNPADARFPLYDLYYSGGTTPNTDCFGGATGCWSFGTATSTGGVAFTKTGGNPVTPHGLLEVFGPDDPHTLWAPSIVDDAGQTGNGAHHARIYYSRITNGDGSDPLTAVRDMFLAHTTPDPAQGPQIVISEPTVFVGPNGSYRKDPDTPIVFYLTDTLGTPGLVGVDLSTLEINLDGSPILGYSIESPHLVSALKNPAMKLSIPSGLNVLADGLHTLSIEVADLEGNLSLESLTWIVDTTPPACTLLTFPADPAIGFPLASIGTFTGEVVEPAPGTEITRLDMYVTNPLGQEQRYEVRGQRVNQVSLTNWEFAWVTPTYDPHLMLPGTYTFSCRAMDAAQNREDVTTDNTVSVMVI